jgi:predicted metal-dependent hydrolase
MGARQLRFAFDEPDLPASPLFVRNPRARRYVLRLLRDGTPRVTIPRWGSRREAQSFLASQAAWIARERERQRARLATRPPREWLDGHQLLLRGRVVVLRHAEGPAARVRDAGDALLVTPHRPAGSRAGDLRPAVTAWLWQLGRHELPPRLRELAVQHGLAVRGVSVRNQRSRWGSCATTGRISLNWRLVQTPDAVRDYVLVHELMHIRQANHSRRFWALVAGACPGFRDARAWLRAHEAVLLD